MLRTRLVWFTAGFTVTGAAIAQFVWKGLLAERINLSSTAKQRFDELEARVANLERIAHETTNPAAQVEGWNSQGA